MTAVLVRGRAAGAATSPAAEPQLSQNATLVLDATAPIPGDYKKNFRMRTARRPDGRELIVDGQSLRLDERPWLPVMGEFHYARYPADEWREELLKMKAGGVDVVASYVFWIHHEEIEGTFDWDGQRSLRRFIELCGEVGLFALLRTGPWCHGEVRNGGLPDWILKKEFRARTNDKDYLEHARRLYGEIAREIDGLLWKHGGPVIGVQCENEYRGPAEHLLALKKIAREVGIDVPLYTRTGWPAPTTRLPVGEILPLFGAYAEGFWDRALTPMPGHYGAAFLFMPAPTDAASAIGQFGFRLPGRDNDDLKSYPYFCCEIGGGMAPSYHRRIRIASLDVASVALVKLGSGNNLQGYYMYHGGANPEGRLSTLQESQATNFPNDLPVKSYDYQAPLGEFGQIRRHYHLLRLFSLFQRDFGSLMATLPACFPEIRPRSLSDAETLRWSARTDGKKGLLFVNNYHRLQTMPAKNGVQFELRLPGGSLNVPAEPFNVPENSVFFWPFRFDLAGARLIYATAQPICVVEDKGDTYAIFAKTPRIPAEFVFDAETCVLEQTSGQVTTDSAGLRIRKLATGTGAAIRVKTLEGARLCIVLLDDETALACWKDELLGRPRIFLTRAGLVIDGNRLRLSAVDPADLAVSVLPAPESVSLDDLRLAAGPDGLFRRFSAPVTSAQTATVSVEPVRQAGPPRKIRMGSKGVAEAPSDADFADAAVWRLRFPRVFDPSRDILLQLRYVGDVARLYLEGRLLTDDFYNGNPFEIGLKRFAPDIYHKELLLKILPLRKNAPIYLGGDAWPAFGEAESLVRLDGVDVLERHHVSFTVTQR
jgi:beta-galactosidase